MRATVEAELGRTLNRALVKELLDAHQEAKRNYFLGGLRLSAVEGGRFGEAAFRILEEVAFGTSTPLGRQLDSERLINRLRSLAPGTQPDSIRLHIPRALRLVYDIRNNRDAAHLADGIDPNLQDASVVVSCIDWVLAELVRLNHGVPPDEAREIVDSIVTRSAPIIQDFDGFLKVLSPNLSASEHCLVLLYHRGERGAALTEIREWVRPKMRANLSRTLSRLVNEKDFVHFDGEVYRVTRLGELEVEARRLIEP